MAYVGLSEIMAEVEALLRGTGLFRLVTRAAITGAENLYVMLPALTTTPAAIVNVPQQSITNPAWRELGLEIIVVDVFRPVDAQAKADSACALLDAALAVLSAGSPGTALALACGAHLMPEGITALAVQSDHSAWLLECRIKAPLTG